MDKVTFNENTFVSFLFTRHNVNAISISDISDSMIGGDKLIHPVKLTKELKELQTNLYKDINPNNSCINKDFAVLSSSLDVLEVHAPKKLEVHKVKEAKIDFSKPLPTEVKVKRKRGRKPKGFVASMINTHIDIDTDQFSGAKRSIDDVDNNAIATAADDDDDDDDYEVVSSNNAPPNMYEIFQYIFDNFYDEIWKIDDNLLRSPYLAIINNTNCYDYGISAYASEDDACSLPIVKEKLIKRSYMNIEDFSYDFHQMFENILKYYPEDNAVNKMSKEIKTFFDKLWVDAMSRFGVVTSTKIAQSSNR